MTDVATQTYPTSAGSCSCGSPTCTGRCPDCNMHETQTHGHNTHYGQPQQIPHHVTVTTLGNGNRTYDWTHPAECADGDTCDILRRTQRAMPEDLTALVEGRPDGSYRLARYGFHGLLLVDDNGNALPDIVEALTPAEQATRDIACDVIAGLAEFICEDTSRALELLEVIRHRESSDQGEYEAGRALQKLIDEHLGSIRPYAKPITRLLGAGR